VLNLKTENDSVLLPVKVVPGASRSRYMGEWDGRARIAVAAPPEKGKANEAVVKLLAELLGVDKRSLEVVAGSTGPLKTIRIGRISVDAVRAALASDRS
jgi:uncharacterized protein (TIGR00251 family)